MERRGFNRVALSAVLFLGGVDVEQRYRSKCRRNSGIHLRMDWLRRLEISTATPPTGPLRLGEIAVEDLKMGETTKGVEAVRRLFREIPAYWPFLPLLYLPFVVRRVDQEVSGCEGEVCSI